MIHIHFFAQLRERLDCTNLNLDYAGEETVADLKKNLIERGNKWQWLDEQQVLIAVNQTLCGLDTPISDEDEIAFFPPVTGG